MQRHLLFLVLALTLAGVYRPAAAAEPDSTGTVTAPENVSPAENLEAMGLQGKKSPGPVTRLVLVALFIAAVFAYRSFNRRRKRKKEEARTHSLHPVIKTIIAYVNQAYVDPELNRSRIAQHVGLHERYVTSLFQQNMQVGLADYINRVRVEHAVELLDTTEKQVDEIAREVGFRSIGSFNRAYRKVTGKNPPED